MKKRTSTNKKLSEAMEGKTIELDGDLTEEEQDDLEEALIGRVMGRKDSAQKGAPVNKKGISDSMPSARKTLAGTFGFVSDQHQNQGKEYSSSEDSLTDALFNRSKRSSSFKSMRPPYNTFKRTPVAPSKPRTVSTKLKSPVQKQIHKQSEKQNVVGAKK